MNRIGRIVILAACAGLVPVVISTAVQKHRISASKGPVTLTEALDRASAGDNNAGPILLEYARSRHLLNGPFGDQIVEAFGKLKFQPAVPVLVGRLKGFPRQECYPGATINALGEIGDASVAPVLRQHLGNPRFSPHDRTAIRRVLILLEEADPVPGLFDLLDKESYEPSRSDIIANLAKYKDQRVVEKLETIATTSQSAFMRREAIFGLRTIGSRQALLTLAALLDVSFPASLTARWGWKLPPDFPTYFPETIAMCLKQSTKQDFGTKRRQWENWINANESLQE